jgi:hypothetical protein
MGEDMHRTRGGGCGSALRIAAFCAAAIFAGSHPAKAQTCPDTPPTQTLKIFNDSDQYLFPELETGQGSPDVWIQAICRVPNSKSGTLNYGRNTTFRFYINPQAGIAPGQSVSITIPLFTQLVSTVDPTQMNQYAEWWQGENIQIFSSPTKTPPRAFAEDYNSISRTAQTPLTSQAANPTFPSCSGQDPCQLQFFSDAKGTLPKNGPSQLFEATLGARQAQPVVNDSPPNSLDVANADFDVSYVNVAYMTGAMGPFENDQVGYVGSPMQPVTPPGSFRASLDQFQQDMNWPRFVVTYADGSTEQIPKLPSPLELLARLSGANPPTDLDPVPQWPTKVWQPIQALRDNWATYTNSCTHSAAGYTTFCDALLDVKQIIMDNYTNYQSLFTSTGPCKGTPVDATPDRILLHVYGWTPWTEAASGDGCGPAANLLENTPGYADNGYEKYAKVKLEFDNLQYGAHSDAAYAFNPWVQFLHGTKYLNIPGVYAYSVDDAVGNIQAEAQGFIIDIGSLQHLENKLPAAPPINISLGYSPTDSVKFASYSVCLNDPARTKPVNPLNPAFIINANAPQNCPVYLTDNKPTPQTYTFTVTKPPPFTIFTLSQVENGDAKWNNGSTDNTTNIIDCSKNLTTSPFQPSSKAWCCSLTNSRGVFAYSEPEPHNPHQSLINIVSTIPALHYTSSPETACSMGH